MERVPSVKPKVTELSANVQMDGVAILPQNVFNVGCILQISLLNSIFIGGKIIGVIINFLVSVDECQKDNDCPLDKACISLECVNPCLSTICGGNALCKVELHTAVCYCPAGLQGNPQISCVEVKCSTHRDCAGNQICDYPPGTATGRKECVPLCTKSPCAPGAVCSAENHQERCTCNPPLTGDGFVLCAERKIATYIKKLILGHTCSQLL